MDVEHHSFLSGCVFLPKNRIQRHEVVIAVLSSLGILMLLPHILQSKNLGGFISALIPQPLDAVGTLSVLRMKYEPRTYKPYLC